MKSWCLLLLAATAAQCEERVAEELQSAPADDAEPKIEFCRTNADCQVAQGPNMAADAGATCDTTTSRCQCTTGFTNREISGVVHYNCYPVANDVAEIRNLLVTILLKMYFRLGNCLDARADTVQDKFTAVVLSILGLTHSRYGGRTNVCGSVNAGVSVQMTLEEMSEKLPTFDAMLGAAVAEDVVLKQVFGDAEPITESTVVEENECELEFTTKTALLVNPGGSEHCSAIECEFGEPFLVSTTDAYACGEPPQGSDDDLSDGAIVGIVLGSLALCCILLALCFCLVKQGGSSEDETEPKNKNMQDEEDESANNHGEPFDQTFSDDNADPEFMDVQV